MIFNLIAEILAGILAIVALPLSLLPDVTLPLIITDSISQIKPYYSSLDTFLPVAVIIILIGVELVYDGAVFGYRGIRWIYQKLPFIN